MFRLTDVNKDRYYWKGVNLELNLSFDNVLKFYELLSDQGIPVMAKLDIALEMFVVHSEILTQLNPLQAQQLVSGILKDKLDIDVSKKKEESDDIPTYNFEEDASYIYASFLFDYNMDLFDQQGKLSWYRFVELFKNLSNDSPMGQAFHYRTCEVPKKTNHNGDEIKRIRAMKKRYELKSATAIRERLEFEAFQEQTKKFKK